MSPRDLDVESVGRKVQGIAELLADLAALGDVDADRLQRDRLVRHAVERIITQVVGLAVSVNAHIAATRLGRAPDTYGQSFELAVEAGVLDAALAGRLRGSTGLRNLLEHEYVDIDLNKVADAVPQLQQGYSEYLRSVARWLREQDQ